ncbi:unnamed protein product, partial [Staurois parvus]
MTTLPFDPYLFIHYRTSACSPPGGVTRGLRPALMNTGWYLDSAPRLIPLLRHGDLPVYLSCWFQISLSTA